MPASPLVTWIRRRQVELALAFSLLTRLPVPTVAAADVANVSNFVWAFPVAGLAVGSIGAVACWLAIGFGASHSIAALAAMAATMLASGALHEDGLADFWDGIGGGRTRARKLEIMRDSGIGSYGAIALFVVLAARWAALSSVADFHQMAAALVLAHTAGRGMLALVFEFWRPARKDGLAAAAGGSWLRAVMAILLTAVIGLAFAEPPITLAAVLAAALAIVAVAKLAARQLGGYTGDVLGAAEQTAEALVLIAVSAALSR